MNYGRDIIEAHCLDYVSKFDPDHYDKCQTFLLECIKEKKNGIFDIGGVIDMGMCPNAYGIDCESLCDQGSHFYNEHGDFSLQRAQCTLCWQNALEKEI